MLQTLTSIFSIGIRAAQFRSITSAATVKLVDLQVNNKTGIATLTLNRPPVNSLNLQLLTEISNALDEVNKNKSKGLILISSFNKAFSAGLDINELYQPEEKRYREFYAALQDMWIKLYGSSYPTAAVINGHAPAGGCLLAISCEYRVMLPNFIIGLNETQLGIFAPKWLQHTMLDVLSRREAEYALTVGKLYKTEEALKINLIDDIVYNETEGISKCESFIQSFDKIPFYARSFTKQMLRSDIINDLKNNRKLDTDQYWSIISKPETQKILDDYLQNLKRRKFDSKAKKS